MYFKSNNIRQQSIGIFDSGIGGLTVAKVVAEILPNESLIYFGDTAHLPYGDKSAAAIKNYSLKIVEMLLKQHSCKLILIACNSATAASYDEVQKHFAGQVLIVNVVDPVINFIKLNYRQKNIGLIGTKLTVNSKIYEKKLEKLNANINLSSLATPLLVPIIEEGLFQHRLMDIILSEYLSKPQLQNIEALVLGCTHYPIIKEKIAKFYDNRISIIDASQIVAEEVLDILVQHNLLNQKGVGFKRFYLSDYTDVFAKQAKLFFGEDVKLEYHPL